jgi:hypothetical protein
VWILSSLGQGIEIGCAAQVLMHDDDGWNLGSRTEWLTLQTMLPSGNSVSTKANTTT